MVARPLDSHRPLATNSGARHALRRSQTECRRMHLVDIENLACGPTAPCTTMSVVVAEYASMSGVEPLDQIIVASSDFASPASWFAAWPKAPRFLVGSGKDGADLELLRVIAQEKLSQRFDEIVLGSGDGIFAEPVARLQSEGCSVMVVSRPECLSRQLRLAAGEIRLLEPEALKAA